MTDTTPAAIDALIDDRVQPLLLAQANQRGAFDWNYGDVEPVIAELLARLDTLAAERDAARKERDYDRRQSEHKSTIIDKLNAKIEDLQGQVDSVGEGYDGMKKACAIALAQTSRSKAEIDTLWGEVARLRKGHERIAAMDRVTGSSSVVKWDVALVISKAILKGVTE